MTELETVAWLVKHKQSSSAGTTFFAEPDFGNGENWDREDYDVTPLVTLSSAQSAIAERDARIAELEAAIDEKEIASGLTSDGNLWRFWSSKAKDVAAKLAAAEARAEAAEALLKEQEAKIERLLLFGGRMANACYNIGQKPKPSHMDMVDLLFAQGEWDNAVRAARSLASKIGGGE